MAGIKYVQLSVTTPSTTWNIAHNLGTKPIVETMVYEGGVLVKAFADNITQTDDNNLVITWTTPRYGMVMLATLGVSTTVYVAPATTYRYLRLTFLSNRGGSYAEIPELRYLVGATAYPTVNMTSISTPSPLVASSSSHYTGTGDASNSWSAFDGVTIIGNPTYGWTSNGGVVGEWLQIDLGSGNGITPTGLRITPWTSGGQSERLPTSFRIDGSNTGTFTGEQTTLKTMTGVSWPGTSAAQTFTF
jgi:hypothetical protein